MPQENSIGNIIYRLRSQKKMTQEELSFGLCSVGTISRIENGCQVPSGGLLKLLLEKLGEPGIFNFAYYLESSPKEENLKAKMLEAFENLDRPVFESAFDEYKERFANQNAKSRQFYEIMGYLYMETLGGYPENPRETLMGFLKISQKELSKVKGLTGGFDLNEMLILNSLALFYVSEKQFRKSKSILGKLIESLDEEKKLLPVHKKTRAALYHNLALALILEGDYYSASQVIERASGISKKEGGLVFILKINALKAYIYETMGMREDAFNIYYRSNLDYKELGIKPGCFWDSMGLLLPKKGIVIFRN